MANAKGEWPSKKKASGSKPRPSGKPRIERRGTAVWLSRKAVGRCATGRSSCWHSPFSALPCIYLGGLLAEKPEERTT